MAVLKCFLPVVPNGYEKQINAILATGMDRGESLIFVFQIMLFMVVGSKGGVSRGFPIYDEGEKFDRQQNKFRELGRHFIALFGPITAESCRAFCCKMDHPLSDDSPEKTFILIAESILVEYFEDALSDRNRLNATSIGAPEESYADNLRRRRRRLWSKRL